MTFTYIILLATFKSADPDIQPSPSDNNTTPMSNETATTPTEKSSQQEQPQPPAEYTFS